MFGLGLSGLGLGGLDTLNTRLPTIILFSPPKAPGAFQPFNISLYLPDVMDPIRAFSGVPAHEGAWGLVGLSKENRTPPKV